MIYSSKMNCNCRDDLQGIEVFPGIVLTNQCYLMLLKSLVTMVVLRRRFAETFQRLKRTCNGFEFQFELYVGSRWWQKWPKFSGSLGVDGFPLSILSWGVQQIICYDGVPYNLIGGNNLNPIKRWLFLCWCGGFGGRWAVERCSSP